MMGDGASPIDDDPQHERFSKGITDLYVTMEDLRQSLRSFEKTTKVLDKNSNGITIDLLQEWQDLMYRMVQITCFLLQFAPNPRNTTTENALTGELEMLQHSMERVLDITKQVLQLCCSQYMEPTHDSNLDDADLPSVEEQRRIGQAAVARVAEMNIIISFHLMQISPSPKSATDTGTCSNGDKKKSNMSESSQVPFMEEILQHYVQFQRRTFRLRCKPSIAHLVDLRCQQNVFTPLDKVVSTASDNKSSSLSSLDTNDNDPEKIIVRTAQEQRIALLLKQYHAPVLTIVLGVAATMIHPLAAWRTHVAPFRHETKTSECTIPSLIHRLCTQSILVIHEQTEALVKSVSEWFYIDRKYIFDLSSSLDDAILHPATSNYAIPQEQQVGLLTAVVDEMAYIAQILERYRALLDSCASDSSGFPLSNSNVIATSILPEWIWQYSALERRLVAHQWQMAFVVSDGTSTRATPVCIVIGTDIRVSSCVEDAQYITSRAMERAMSTQSLHAMATIAYAIARDIWATESPEDEASQSSMTLYKALREEIGCWSEPESSFGNGNDAKKISNATSPSSGGFANALLDALDEDMDHPPSAVSVRSPGNNTTSPIKPPRSGGTSFLSSLISSSGGNEQSTRRQLDTLFCVCNSLYAAACACRSVVSTLDEILLDYGGRLSGFIMKVEGDLPSGQCSESPVSKSSSAQCEVTKKAVSLIDLARDELLQYSGKYQELLNERIGESVRLWCYGRSSVGSIGKISVGCLDVLQDFFANENYEIDGPSFTDMEADERLENEVLLPLKKSPLLHQLTEKCEAPIVQIFSERIAMTVVDMLLDLLWMMDSNGSSDVDNEKSGAYHSSKQMRFTDWGALLLSKESRLLQHYISVTLTQQNGDSLANSDTSDRSATSMAVFQIWERLSQVVTILQLEKPIDWLIYHSTSKLTPEEVSRTMHLRVDFSNDAIERVVTDICSKYASKNTTS
jgi:hypothetical protein